VPRRFDPDSRERMANKDNPRARRLGEQIQRELTELLRRDVKDERIGNVTITAVTSPAICAPRGALPGVRQGRAGPQGAGRPHERRGIPAQCLSKSLMIRYTPTLSFALDTSIEHGVRLTQLIDSVTKPGASDRPLRGRLRGGPDSRATMRPARWHVRTTIRTSRGSNAGRYHGILLLDKPLGVSSAAAVARAKRLFEARKAGHTGSLDPLASGMLPICFGEATKFGALLLDADKTYRVTVRLGERTPSADRESEVIERRELPPFSPDQLEQALEEFPREYSQVPPMHSAIKQDGKPLYEYARAGITRERAARSIVIHDMRLLDWQRPICPSMCAARRAPTFGCWPRTWRRASAPSAT
jgi:tRNA pseudouridine(55) synthase